MIGRELKRILQKPTALVCVIIYIAVLFLGIESDLRAGYETGMLNLFWFTENFGATIFIQTRIYVLIGLCVSVFCTNQYVFYAMPFLLTRVGTYIGGVLALDAYIPYGKELLADGGWGICLTRNLAAYAVLGFLYYREMKWRGING